MNLRDLEWAARMTADRAARLDPAFEVAIGNLKTPGTLATQTMNELVQAIRDSALPAATQGQEDACFVLGAAFVFGAAPADRLRSSLAEFGVNFSGARDHIRDVHSEMVRTWHAAERVAVHAQVLLDTRGQPTTGPSLALHFPVPGILGSESSYARYYAELVYAGKLLTYDPVGGGGAPVPVPVPPVEWIDVMAYGARGDGTTDDTGSIQSAIDACASAGGGIVYFPRGKYIVSAGLSVTASNIRLLGDGPGLSVIAHKITGSGYVLTFTGSLTATLAGALTSLTADAGPDQANATWDNGKSLTLASTSGISAGDWLLIGDQYNTPDFAGQGWPNRWRGEFNRVASVNSGTSVTLRTTLRDDYTVARSASVWKPTFLKNVGVEGLSVRADGPLNTTTVGGIKFEACLGVLVQNASCESLDHSGLALVHCVNSLVTGYTAQDLTDATGSARFGYGVVISSCEEVVVDASIFRKTRHGIATGAVSNRFGWCRNVRISNCTSVESTSSAYDTHPHTTDVTFIGCVADRPLSTGFNIRSQRTRITGCTVLKPKGDAFTCQLGHAIDVLIEGNTAIDCGRYGYYQTGSVGDGYPSNVTIKENTFIRTYSFGVRLTEPSSGLKILNNDFLNCNVESPTTGPGGVSIWGTHDGMDVSDNYATGVNSVVHATAGTTTNSQFVGNRLANPVGSTIAAVKGSPILTEPTNKVALSVVDGAVSLGQATASSLGVVEGTNATMGTAALVGGTITVNTTAVSSTSRIYYAVQTAGGTQGHLRIAAKVNGTSFTITSTSATETSTVAWWIVRGV